MNLVDPSGNPVSSAPDDATAAEAQRKAQRINAELAARRKILHADELAALVAPRAVLESEFPNLHAYFFTIAGMLNGRKISGAMWGGECILVFAPNFSQAQELANQGLRATVELLFKEYDTRQLRGADLTPVEQGLMHEVAGRRGKTGEGPPLQKNPKLKHMIEHLIGGKPWTW
jgi:hypothetical protein